MIIQLKLFYYSNTKWKIVLLYYNPFIFVFYINSQQSLVSSIQLKSILLSSFNKVQTISHLCINKILNSEFQPNMKIHNIVYVVMYRYIPSFSYMQMGKYLFKYLNNEKFIL